MLWLILIGVLFILTYYKIIKPLSYWKDRNVVQEKSYPLIGGMSNIIFQRKAFFDHDRDIYKKFSNHRYFGFHQFNKPVLYIRDIELIKKITIKDFDQFMDRTAFVPEHVEPLIDKNLSALKGQRWRDMRATLSPSFTSSKMKFMFTLLSDCAQEFTNYLEKENQDVLKIEMKDAFTRFTNDAIASVAFGLKCNSMEDRTNEFFVMGKRATTIGKIRSLLMTLYRSFPQLSKILRVGFFPSSVNTFFLRVVKETITLRESEKLIRPDMIHLLLEARKEKTNHHRTANESKSNHLDHKNILELTDEDITSQALVFFFAGFDTTSTLLSFLAYELALNPGIQETLQNEIEQTFTECNGNLTYEALHKMKYMDMVVSEALRKWTPGFQIDRVCVSDYTIEPVNSTEKPLLIKKGTMLVVPVIGLHYDPKYFPNPEKFDPDRFNEENKRKIEPFSYIPFGAGPRICIASRFALMEIKTIIFHLLFKFDIIPIDKTEIPVTIKKIVFNLMPRNGIWLGLKQRART